MANKSTTGVLKQLAAALFAMILTSAATAAVSEATLQKDAATQLAALLRGYQTYQADFIQIVVGNGGERIQESRGSMKAKRPGLFYWESKAPMAQHIVSNGDEVSVYDPDLEQVTVHKLDSNVQATPALLLSGEVDNLAQTYDVSTRRVGDNIREFTLTPKSPDSLFVALRMSFFDGQLQEMRMEDSLSQISILSFDDIVLNADIAASVFKPDYPAGVDIIRDGS
ncbi:MULTISPECIES: outer membrane lipoprotein chaperone LolA [unclassified Marinobacter]|uniref:outer membrane lipoprotein chaperone LolA n=1 Tax=unclassified Marinobacter TaxID=83889 RepID=UPI00200D647D|nr:MULTISPECIES: outer membrane lipoprotein chaperone LolA [unclassified Marinobacter]MCL1476132.1 outer membrane lipoprotein chaperone LolA [Marinobacter sp.]MCL1488706.1 outer membrane lipoprotein chaperone LolA [Marinobacter sp.]UQG54102.1 outer membrane lipoprotein chaperone LolA [Marinobacter sp. M4C]UQG62909.1 outer membrane lipoprotein chaperone LolA [Marinobacter sp. M2C]UQG67187.1 outer membrane lipoprotein chaperone LolA [Marinobacter sp. M1C]